MSLPNIAKPDAPFTPIATAFRHALLVALMLTIASCASSPPATPQSTHYRPDDPNDIAVIGLSTSLIWPWDAVAQDIQPTFVVKPQTPSTAIQLTSQASDQATSTASASVTASLGAPAHAH